MTHTHKAGMVLVTIITVTHDLWRSFMTGTSDFEKIERKLSKISGVGDPVFPTALRTFKLLSFWVHGSGVEKSLNLQFAVQWQDTIQIFIKI